MNANALVQTSDAVAVAAQIGRLDFISALLAVIALLLGLGAIPLFVHLRTRAKEVATAAVNERMAELEGRLEAEAILKMEEMLPILVAQYRELAQNSVTEAQGNGIADAQDDPQP
ncbi:hypothetical protein [Sphingomonas pokkalii]|uniref:Uncharacterized protein n=1 Tax=Sphingomonas pokkalii TaxID=2175090 RepID=A0A2U0SCE1_9SPHN|nr:hypothetical protein [Sphingomonas pokkalii]PVX28945.1 hypothetical protein DD559_06030 [Sphingomonas pokkalii]